MLKRQELINASSCLNKAEPDEPIFVLRAKDPAAAQTIRLWAAMAFGLHEPQKVIEARELADLMDKWRDERQPKMDAQIKVRPYYGEAKEATGAAIQSPATAAYGTFR